MRGATLWDSTFKRKSRWHIYTMRKPVQLCSTHVAFSTVNCTLLGEWSFLYITCHFALNVRYQVPWR